MILVPYLIDFLNFAKMKKVTKKIKNRKEIIKKHCFYVCFKISE